MDIIAHQQTTTMIATTRLDRDVYENYYWVKPADIMPGALPV